MAKKYESITIYFDDDHEPEETIEEVLELVKKGYVEGHYPTFHFNKEGA